MTPEENLGGLNASASYDPHNEIAITFGGQGSFGGTSNFFFYDAYANHLHRVQASNPPSQRDGSGVK